jgi:hypothetical protein
VRLLNAANLDYPNAMLFKIFRQGCDELVRELVFYSAGSAAAWRLGTAALYELSHVLLFSV